MNKVEEQMGNELDIVHIIKNLRSIKHALIQRGMIKDELSNEFDSIYLEKEIDKQDTIQ